MNFDSNLIFGIFALGYGIISTILWFVNPSVFGKLEAMKQKFGEKAGAAIHFVCYCIVPIIAGAVFLYCNYLNL